MPQELLHCYNLGCGQKYNPDDNKEDSCTNHSGEPVFHDAYKGWSCCNKKTTDFTEFLNIKGCTKSFHSNIKPPEPERRVVDQSKKDEVIVVKPPTPSSLERPPFDSPLTELKPSVAASLKQQLEGLVKLESSANEDSGDGVPPIGTSCKNGGCKASYEGVQSIDDQCTHHPGFPVFHEGMKYWSCCVRKTSDFNLFLEQVGCSTGKHVWFKKQDRSGVSCRYDWHQTGNFTVVSVFAKKYDPVKSVVKVNPIRLVIQLYFPESEDCFNLDLELGGVINVAECSAQMLSTKVEVKLRKAEPSAWKNLFFSRSVGDTKSTPISESSSNTDNLESRVDAVDLSDL